VNPLSPGAFSAEQQLKGTKERSRKNTAAMGSARYFDFPDIKSL
jgi:hypothetical protein